MSAYIVAEKTMHAAVWALTRDWGAVDNDDLTSRRTRLGQKLYRLNQLAVFDRYHALDPIPKYQFCHIAPSDVQALKCLRCLIYQCAEGDVINTPLFRKVDRASRRLAKMVLAALGVDVATALTLADGDVIDVLGEQPAYEQAHWNWED